MSELLKIFEFTTREVRDLAREQSVADAPVTVDGVTIIPISTVSCGFSRGSRGRLFALRNSDEHSRLKPSRQAYCGKGDNAWACVSNSTWVSRRLTRA